MGWKVGSFYRMKNKEQEKEKQKMNKKQGSKYRAQSWLGIRNWLTEYTMFLVKRNVYWDMKVVLSLSVLTCCLSRSGSLLDLEIYFNNEV